MRPGSPAKLTIVLAPEPGSEPAESPNRNTESPPGAGSPSVGATAPKPSPDNQDAKLDGDGDASKPQDGSGSGSAGSIGNLWSAIQSVASNVANSQGPLANPTPVSSPGADQAANNPPVFTFQGQTLSPGNAATFGGSPVSGLSGQDGVVVDGTQTVLVPDGQATTIQQSGLEPLTVSRSGSVIVIDGQTLSPGQQVTAGQTTVSLAQSTGVLYVNGAATTLAGPSITIGGTVYTAPADASASGDDLGGYIYSGIGGSPTSGSPQNSGSANKTGTTPSTASGSRMKRWDFYSCAMMILAFWLV
jgi:hypothetical protein